MTSSASVAIEKDTEKVPELQSYILFYRHGVNPHCQKGFMHKGDLKSAVTRAQRHCEIMNYRYIFVRPMLVDLDYEEQQKLDRGIS